ncbi:CynX/NimT family MFS transporter [Chloroflexota bacterium]
MSTINGLKKESKYRWYILFLVSFTAISVFAMPMMCMPVLFKEISNELGLSLVQLGVVWGIIPLAGTFVVLFGGLLSDRFGAKRILTIGCLLTSLAGILRGVSNGFIVLTLTMFLFGLLMTITAPSMIKTLSTWFTKERLALANGVLSMAMAVGFMVGSMISATVLSPALGGWRNVLYFYGIFGIIMSVLWGFSRRMPRDAHNTTEPESTVPFKQSFLHVFRTKRVWLLALITMGQISCIQGTLGYLPVYLRDTGWSETSADGTLTLFHAASMIGAVPMTLLSNRFKSRTTVLFVGVLATAIGVGMLAISGGPLVWVAVVIAGIVRDGFMAISSTMIIETDGIGMIYAGTAIGLGQTVNRIGEFISPPVGNSLAIYNPRLPFVFWAALPTAALGVFYFLREKPSPKLKMS